MKIYPIHAGRFKLDGGAMFGVVPKSIWQKTNPADENNMSSWVMRCMLIVDGNRKILIDNGMGTKQSDKFYSHYYLHGDETLEKSLAEVGVKCDEITDVFLTHLHFDHCGGSVNWNADKTGFELAFKNAKYWSHSKHWDWATVNPNPREAASFFKENLEPVEKSGKLFFADKKHDLPFKILTVSGHTESQMIPIIQYQGKTLVYMADLLPSVGHIPLPYIMGYDVRPLLTMDEKKTFLDKAADNNYVLFLEHDYINECCTVIQTEKGVRLDKTYAFNELFD